MVTKTKYYRNKTEVKGCEPESLWKLTNGCILILVDEDQYIFARIDDHLEVFYEVPDPLLKVNL